MAELVDALDSKSSAARRAGSIPALGTILGKPFYKSFPNFFFKFHSEKYHSFFLAYLLNRSIQPFPPMAQPLAFR